MRKRIFTFVALALAVMAIAPAVATATTITFEGLHNEYGMNYAGQTTCTLGGCHYNKGVDDTVHSRFAKPGLVPSAPAGWTNFTAAGNPTPKVGATAPAVWDQGGTYSIPGNTWATLGDYAGGSPTEYLFFKASADKNILPWNLVEGLQAFPDEGWSVGAEAPTKGLYDVQYSCQRCHMLGATIPQPSASPSAFVPNPAATLAASPGTARQWARPDSASVTDFMSTASVSQKGFGIQCESCHGTGVADSGGTQHMITGVKVNTTLDVLGDSQVCGQCHGSYTNVADTLGIYGYTANRRMADFVDINGLSGGQSYTKIPTDSEFMAAGMATKYFMFPNGSNAKGSHYYYNEWSASAHSYRPALTSSSADALAFQKNGGGSFAVNFHGMNTQAAGCTKCHTGEDYLKSKNDPLTRDMTMTAANVGKMGQECVTCHSAHPSAPGADDVLRAPDKAGERSAKGLTVDNASICEDCHNWQYEVLGTTPVPAPMATLSAHGGASHPQRESLHGRVMIDVPQAGEFMPDVTCQECHMPKTNKADNRYSHGMKPMLPGDAQKWNDAANVAAGGAPSYLGEDSCSTCHVSRSRTELQDNIDTWQSETQAKADAAEAAIKAVTEAATPPAEYSLTDSSKPGYVLIGRATWNYKAFENDASTGVHNPEYIGAGLDKATKMAKSVGGSFAQLSAPNSVVPGGTAFVSGKIVNGNGSNAVGGSLKLMNGAALVGQTTSDENGAFTFLVTPAGAQTFTVVWARSSSAITNLTSIPLTVNVAKEASKTTVAASAKTIKVNKSVTQTGKVTPADIGAAVQLKYRKGSGAWKTINLTLGSSSTYSKSVKLTSKGTWSFQTSYLGTATVAASKSTIVKVTVN